MKYEYKSTSIVYNPFGSDIKPLNFKGFLKKVDDSMNSSMDQKCGDFNVEVQKQLDKYSNDGWRLHTMRIENYSDGLFFFCLMVFEREIQEQPLGE